MAELAVSGVPGRQPVRANAPADPVVPPEPVVPIPSEEDATPQPIAEDVGNLMFEDFFPPLDLTEDQKKGIAQWLIRDLKTCVRYVNSQRDRWAVCRAVFLLQYTEKFYPEMNFSANFASGVLCEKVLAAMSRLKRAVFKPRPYFVADDKTSNVESIELIHRIEWFMQTLFEEDLEILEVMGPEAFFDFIMDGSLIMEADQMYEKIPQRNLKTYLTEDELIVDQEKMLDPSEFDKALQMISQGEPARVLIEEDLLTKNGLQLFQVDKVDHLIPPNVTSDRDIKFRGRRMYLTEADLRLLASDGVNWYRKEDVEKVVSKRNEMRNSFQTMGLGGDSGKASQEKEEVTRSESGSLAYGWRNEEQGLKANQGMMPYKNTFAVYRVLCKYAYKTSGDPKGLIPKYCTFDIEPESAVLLRYRTYPHFKEKRNYFHFKLSHTPKSYYGFGYGARLINDDYIQTNALNLFFDATALSTFQPFICVHPEEGGMIPFKDGIGPFKVGFVKNPADFKPFEIPAPPLALLQHLVPLTKTTAENKTSVTSLVQGKAESTDPRSPAKKTQLLLGEASVGIEDQIEDFVRTGWNPLADFVWMAYAEILTYQGEPAFEGKIDFPGLDPELEKTNIITLDELRKKVRWKAQASATFLNTQVRETSFLRHFQFFSPLLQAVAQFNPDLFKKYFLRWMRQAGEELEVRNLKYLIPSAEELGDIPAEELSQARDSMVKFLRSGQAPEVTSGGGKINASPQR